MKKLIHPGLAQEALCRWMLEEHGVTVTQGTISDVLKRSADLIGPPKSDTALHSKRHRAVSYPLKQAASFMKTLYPTVKDEDAPAFSITWLQKSKNLHGICLHLRFGESGSIDIEALEERLPEIRAQLDQYNVVDTFNVEETGLFYRLQTDS
uniref:Transposase n=1 Tax=Peronospora matthiolae TaxID=2874970 RepID=A0AAV1T6R5_9STRA